MSCLQSVWEPGSEQKMASSFLDDLISNPSADADAVSALVGSLESQLSNANVGASNNTQGGGLAFTTSSTSSVPPPLQPANTPSAATTTATFAGNGSSLHAITTCAPAASVPIGSALSTVPSSVSSIHLPNTTTVHSILPNGNPSGMVNIQQFAGGAIGLPNGTVATSSGNVNTTLSGLVIHQQQQKMVASTATSQQPTMIIPAKVNPTVASTTVMGQQQHHQQHQQQTVLNTNGTVTLNSSQVLRQGTQVVQQQQQTTVINSAGTGILPAGVQVVNMNAMRPQNVQNLQNMAALNNPAHRTLAPRVMLAPQQMVGARPGQMGITLQALQAAGAQGHLLVKTETGQYQLLRVGPGPVTGTTVGSQVVTSNIPSLQNVAQQQQQHQQQQQQQPQQQQQQQNVQQLTTTSNAMPTMNQNVGATYRLQVPVSTTIQPVSATTAAPVGGSVSVTATNTSAPTPAPAANPASNSGQMTPDTAKVKCKNFLSTLLRLASEQPESVATNVQMLIQGLVDAKVEPEEFTTKLQRELNSSPQPCLIPFLKKSLPYLRQSLALRELHIDGIRPPALSTVNAPQPMVIQQHPQQQSVVNRVNAGPTQIQTVRPMGGQVRLQTPTMVGASAGTLPAPRPPRPAANKATPKAKAAQQAPKVTATTTAAAASTTITAVSAIKTEPSITSESPAPIAFTIHLPQVGGVTSASTAITPGPTPLVTVASTSATPTSSTATKPTTSAATVSVGPGGIKGPLPPPTGPKDASKEKKAFTFGSSLAGLADNDINDVAAMGGVNLAEESQRILGSTDMIGTQIRSCKDENFLFTGPLQRRIQQIASRNGLGDPSPEVVSLISHATQERLKTLLEKLAVTAEHRMEVVKTDARYEVQQDVKGQLKFLEELDKLERRRHSEIQREMLLKAAKSRSKAEDPEQAKLKAKAKEMQRAEMEELRQREANMTALQAIGIRKKPKLDLAGTTGSYNQVPLRPRVKRVNLRDLLFLLKEEKGTIRSPLLYKAYLK